MLNISFNDMYKNVTTVITIITIMVILTVYFYVIPKVNHMMVFRPRKATQSELNNIIHRYKNNIDFVNFNSTDGTELSALFMNYYKQPSYDDKIFLYSHGNGGWLGAMPWCNSIKMLSKFGSIFVYDYRQYGVSKGLISEEGCYMDVMGAWEYLTKKKKVLPENIVIFGHSLGCAMSTKLVADLVEQNNKNKNNYLPSGLIMWAPFSSIQDMGDRLLPGLGLITTIKMNNLENLKIINDTIPIIIFHSKEDNTTPYYQSEKLEKYTYAKLHEISGPHCQMIYTKKTIKLIGNLIKTK